MYNPLLSYYNKKVFIDFQAGRVIFILDSVDEAEAIVERINNKIVFANEDVSLKYVCEFAEIEDTSHILKDILEGVYSHDKYLTDLDEHPVNYKSFEDHGFYIRRNTLHTWILSLPMPKMKSLEEYLEKEEKDISPKPGEPLKIKDKPDKAENTLDQIGIILNRCSYSSSDIKLDLIKELYDKWLAKNE